MRGKVWINLWDKIKERITPAYAGKSFKTESNACETEDHPRLCGEKDIQNILDAPNEGITPAYAGKRGGNCEKVH